MASRGRTQRPAPLRSAPSERGRQRSVRSYLAARPSVSAELLFVAPLFVVYQVGALLGDARNGVDLVTTLVLRLGHASAWAFWALAAAAAVVVIWVYVSARRRERFGYGLLFPVLLESGLYALVMGSAILLVMFYLLGLRAPSLGPLANPTWLDVIYVSAGAGVHEELVFRVLIYGLLLATLGSLVGPRSWPGRALIILLALLASSALFSISHHAPPHGEVFTTFAFVYRLLAGCLFGLMYHYRGFAVAVYTHFLYDVMVLGLGRG
jgi:hypothetical protein